jgi:hypothetical protein
MLCSACCFGEAKRLCDNGDAQEAAFSLVYELCVAFSKIPHITTAVRASSAGSAQQQSGGHITPTDAA